MSAAEETNEEKAARGAAFVEYLKRSGPNPPRQKERRKAEIYQERKNLGVEKTLEATAKSRRAVVKRKAARKHSRDMRVRAENRTKFRQNVQHGDLAPFAQSIRYFIEDIRMGKTKAPSLANCRGPGDESAYYFLRALINFDYLKIRRMANCVEHYQKRAKRKDGSFQIPIPHADPRRAELFDRTDPPDSAIKGEIPRTTKETAEWMKQVGFPTYADGTLRADPKDIWRIYKGLGGRTERVGRPRKL